MSACTGCGAVSVPGARFCSRCGVALSGSCSRCGSAMATGARFCRSCGNPVAIPEPSGDPNSVEPASRDRDRRPLVIAAAIAVAAIAIGSLWWLMAGHSSSGAIRATPTTAVESVQTTSPRANNPGTGPGGLEARRFAASIGSLLKESAAARRSLGLVIRAPGAPGAVAEARAVVVARKRELGELSAIPAASDPEVVSLLRDSLSGSLTSDRLYLQWVSALDRGDRASATASLAAAYANDKVVDPTKSQFLVAYNRLLSRIGKPTLPSGYVF